MCPLPLGLHAEACKSAKPKGVYRFCSLCTHRNTHTQRRRTLRNSQVIINETRDRHRHGHLTPHETPLSSTQVSSASGTGTAPPDNLGAHASHAASGSTLKTSSRKSRERYTHTHTSHATLTQHSSAVTRRQVL